MKKHFALTMALVVVALSVVGCDAQGVCVSDFGDEAGCMERAKSDCENDNGTFHEVADPKAPNATDEACKKAGFPESYGGIYRRVGFLDRQK